VSSSTTSAPLALADVSVSNATDAGSDPISWRIIVAPARSAQTLSWSMAAARNVSAAPIQTFSPALVSCAASLPMVVVLPAPLTPTTITT